MEKINEITIPEGVNRIAVKQHDDKIVIEFIPEKRKFKAGDKVKIKDGISSKTHRSIKPNFTSTMDKFIGKELTVKGYSGGYVFFNEDDFGYKFDKDWLEPWSDEPKNGDLAIFWDNESLRPLIRLYHAKQHNENRHCDKFGGTWENAIKFGSKEQFEKVLRGEI